MNQMYSTPARHHPVSCLHLWAVQLSTLTPLLPIPPSLLPMDKSISSQLMGNTHRPPLLLMSHPLSSNFFSHIPPPTPPHPSRRCGSVIRDDDDNREPVHYRIDWGRPFSAVKAPSALIASTRADRNPMALSLWVCVRVCVWVWVCVWERDSVCVCVCVCVFVCVWSA